MFLYTCMSGGASGCPFLGTRFENEFIRFPVNE